ncbi:hypothetical protein ACPEEZ_12930 [Frigoribacterium sp. 2-23]|uniref:hypothetical protein n=1 Tax=Frigoribacterium sp. 2-23 TaxID=3415006 RepID=UPI003C704594
MSNALSRAVRGTLRRHPWVTSALSAVFLALIVWAGASHGWDLAAVVGAGFRRAPLWLLLVLGVPLFGAGVIVGIRQQMRLHVAKDLASAPPSPEVERLRRDGPGWLTRRAAAVEKDDSSAD